MSKSKISTFQFFSMLFLTRLLTTFTYIPSYTKDIELSDLVVQAVLRYLICVVMMIPVYFLFKRNPDMNILDIVRNKWAKGGKILAVFYSAVLFYFTVTTVSRLDLFTGTIVFPETNVNYFLVFVILIGCYGAYLGIEALGRSAVLSVIPVTAALVFIIATLIGKIDFLNYTPVFYKGVLPVFKTALNAAGRTVELVMITLAIPVASGKKTKSFFIWIFLQALVTASLFFVEVGVMGNFTNTQLFPVHSLAALAKFSMFGRLDPIITGIWILCAFLKVSFLLYLQGDILHKEFENLSKKTILAGLGALSSVICLYVAGSVQRFTVVDNSLAKLIATALAATVIPAVMLVLNRRKKYE